MIVQGPSVPPTMWEPCTKVQVPEVQAVPALAVCGVNHRTEDFTFSLSLSNEVKTNNHTWR